MKRIIKKTIAPIIILFACMAVQAHFSITMAEKDRKDPYYVGMEKCKECHPEYVKTHSGWKYSRNFRILEMRHKEHDPQCLPCHTTGYGQPGGFVSIEETPHMKNIQCEACHGPASLHIEASTSEEHRSTLSIPKNVCTTCHRQHKHMGY